MAQKTSWLRVALAIGGGIAIAALHGKMAAAIPLLREDFSLSLTEAGILAAAVPILSMLSGSVAAQLAGKIGLRRAAVIGLFLCAAGSLLGALSQGFYFMLATRLVESIGYLLGVVTLPTLVGMSSSARHRPQTMGIWAGFIPVGITLALLLSTLIVGDWGWQGLWVTIGVVTAMLAFGIVSIEWKLDHVDAQSNLRWLLKKPIVWLLMASFLLFSLQFTGVAQFIPSMLLDTSGLGLRQASVIVAVIIVLNLVGNLIGGRMVGAGKSLSYSFTVALVAMAICLALLHLPALPLWVRLVSGCAYGALSGIMPGAIWAYIPTVFEHGKRTTALTGVVMQGATTGQFLGPILIGIAVDISGRWESIIVLVWIACTACLAIGWSSAVLRQGKRAVA